MSGLSQLSLQIGIIIHNDGTSDTATDNTLAISSAVNSTTVAMVSAADRCRTTGDPPGGHP